MTSTEHHKHPKLKRPSLGHFGRNEWAILGAPCEKIQSLAQAVIRHLSPRYTCAYADARHISGQQPHFGGPFLASGALLEFTDAETSRSIQLAEKWSPVKQKALFSDCDLVLINGNHHAAFQQVLVIDPKKQASVQRRLEQLTNVQLVLLLHEGGGLFEFLEKEKPEITLAPRLWIGDEQAIFRFFETEMEKRIPVLNGLVLAGGFSVRMGEDKGLMKWHGKAQREYMLDLLRPLCTQSFLSCRSEQIASLPTGVAAMPDSFLDLGPLGALLSAFRANPETAWLVTACDMPLLDAPTLLHLIRSRRPSAHATAFLDPTGAFPEPLATIWEPKSYPALLSMLSQGISCPRKALTLLDCELIPPPDPEALRNVNSPEDAAQIREWIQGRQNV